MFKFFTVRYSQQMRQQSYTYRNYRTESFICDVKKAEEYTGGDINIVDKTKIKINTVKEKTFVKNSRNKNYKQVLTPIKTPIVGKGMNNSALEPKT